MKFSKYISKAVTPVMALFQKQHGCLSNKATTICGYSVCSLRQVPVRHNRGGKSTENKVRFAPPTMCRLTVKCRPTVLRYGCLHLFCNDYTLLRPQIEPNQSHLIKQMPEARINTGFRHFSPLFKLPNLILVLNIFVKAFCYDLTPFGFICTNHMCCMS